VRNNRLSLKALIVPSIPLAILIVSACFLLWVLSFIQLQLSSSESLSLNNFQKNIIDNTLLINLLNFIISLFNAFLLVQLNNKFTIIKTRTFFPVLIYLMLIGTWSLTHLHTSVHIILSLFIFLVFFLFDMYRDKNAVEQSFLIGLVIGICGIIFNPFLLFIPLIWFAYIMFQTLSLRTFLASIFGVLSCWLMYISVSYFFIQNFSFYNILSIQPNLSFEIIELSIPTLIYISIITLISIISIIGMYSNFHIDAIHTRTKLNFFVLVLISVSILTLFFWSDFIYFLPIIGCVYAILVSHAFTLKQNKFFSILFIIFCIVNITYAITSFISF